MGCEFVGVHVRVCIFMEGCVGLFVLCHVYIGFLPYFVHFVQYTSF